MKRAQSQRFLGILLVALVASASALCGCDSGDQGKTVTQPKTDQAEIDRINSSHIPNKAKAAAIQGMKDGKAEAQRMKGPAPQ